MIQYKYFHTDASGFVSRMSISREDPNYRYFSELFERVRKGAEINSGGFEDVSTFTYATVEDSSLFVQATKGVSSSLFVDGLLCEDIPVQPSRYIGCFEQNKSAVDEDAAVLPEGRLPAIGNRGDSFSLASNLHHIFGKLIDALIFGEKDKQIIIVADDYQSAVNYVKVLSLLLPPAYMKKIGFSIGTSSIPYEPWTVVKNDGSSATVGIKMWLPNMPSFSFESYSSFYYVFDTKTGRDNYTRPLSSVARLVDEINLANSAAATDLARTLAGAFTADGSVDTQLLERISSLYLFDIKGDVETAKSILAMGSGNDALQERAVMNAIRILLSPENVGLLTPSERSAILREYRTNPRVAQEIEGDLFRYFSGSYQSLQAEERTMLENMLASDASGERLGEMLDNVPYADFTASVEAFGLACRVVGACLSRGYNVHNLQEILRKIVEFFDINTCRRAIPNEQLSSGERFFDVAWQMGDLNLKVSALALLMASAYFSDTDDDCCNIRIRGLKRVLSSSQLTSLQKLEILVGVREKILEFSDELSNIDCRVDFLFNTEVGKLWMQELIASFSAQDLLSAYRLTYSRTSGRIIYEGMISALNTRLLDAAYVRRNIAQGTPLYRTYVEFYYSLPQELQAANVEINAYLNELNHGDEIGHRLAQERSNFLLSCLETMSPKDRARISKEQVNILNVAQYSEQISAAFLPSHKASGRKAKRLMQRILTVVNGIAWCAISFVLMELLWRGAGMGLQDHLSLVYDIHALPTITMLCSGSLYAINLNTNSFTKRNVFTAVETLILLVVLFGAFRLLLL